jgi:hypothetical protein
MSYTDEPETDPTTTWFASRRREQGLAHNGATLRAFAEVVLAQLPTGPLTLVALSVEGCALAAAVAALRAQTTNWEQISLGRKPANTDLPVVLVEPIELAPGLLTSFKRQLPRASVIHAIANGGTALAAAA